MRLVFAIAVAAILAFVPRAACAQEATALAAREILLQGTDADGIRPSALQKAAAMLDAAMARGEADARVLALRGRVAVHLREQGGGERWLEQARALAPADGWVLYLLADARRVADPEGAAAQFDAALAAGIPFVPEARAALLEAMPRALRARDRASSDRLYAQWRVLEPDRADVASHYAMNVMLHFGDFAAGERHARSALAISPDLRTRQTLSLALYGQWAVKVRAGATADAGAQAWARADSFDPGAVLLPDCEARLPAVSFIYSLLEQQAIRPKETRSC